ncbi:MAG TPA: hypothetical protein VIW67_17020 [Terriglobales bacterium]
MTPKRRLGAPAAVCLIIFYSVLLFAQEEGSITGRATDSAGAVLQGA